MWSLRSTNISSLFLSFQGVSANADPHIFMLIKNLIPHPTWFHCAEYGDGRPGGRSKKYSKGIGGRRWNPDSGRRNPGSGWWRNTGCGRRNSPPAAPLQEGGLPLLSEAQLWGLLQLQGSQSQEQVPSEVRGRGNQIFGKQCHQYTIRITVGGRYIYCIINRSNSQ
jgi:hypothetical protein